LLNFATLYLISGISIIVLGLLGYVSSSKRLPFLAVVIALPVIALLHNGKTAMREKYWDRETPMPSLTELPGFFTEWIQDGLDRHQKNGMTDKLIERTSLFQMICLVVDNTPDRLPFLNGETYGQIPGQFVPRFFWADKPLGHVSTYTLSIYYGLQRPEDTQKTTIAFGLLAEAYANFGFYGVGIFAAVFAFCLKKYGLWAQQSPILSYAGLLLVLLMAWSFQTELTLSAWLSSLFQAAVAVLGVPFFLRHFLG
ncbi:MAG TPA: O-antigen polysaccharide polymerase Wzy, partial [Opitutaceae bacterium]|nr:O-antigen polysaccharide polymerase Wzy [Opitutaceae bacterium]